MPQEDTINIKSTNNIGGNGIWYKDTGGQDLMFNTHGWEQSGKSWMPIAWDLKLSSRTDGKSTKGFGYHASIAAVHETLMQTPMSNRNGYEIIAKDTPCLPYLDIEFLVPNDGGRDHMTDPDHGKLIMVLEAVRQNFKAAYGVDALFTVLIGSRKKDAKWFKCSYHALITNICMKNNHDGMMKRLTEVGMEAGDDDDAKDLSLFYYYDEYKQKYMHIIDEKVYTSNRQMRMLWCSKFGSDVPLKKLVPVTTDMQTISTALLLWTTLIQLSKSCLKR
jgi:hypothetical protein